MTISMRVKGIFSSFLILALMNLSGCDQSNNRSNTDSVSIPDDVPEAVVQEKQDDVDISGLMLVSDINDALVSLNWQRLEGASSYLLVISGMDYPFTEVDLGDVNSYEFTVNKDDIVTVIVKAFNEAGEMVLTSPVLTLDMMASDQDSDMNDYDDVDSEQGVSRDVGTDSAP